MVSELNRIVGCPAGVTEPLGRRDTTHLVLEVKCRHRVRAEEKRSFPIRPPNLTPPGAAVLHALLAGLAERTRPPYNYCLHSIQAFY